MRNEGLVVKGLSVDNNTIHVKNYGTNHGAGRGGDGFGQRYPARAGLPAGVGCRA